MNNVKEQHGKEQEPTPTKRYGNDGDGKTVVEESRKRGNPSSVCFHASNFSSKLVLRNVQYGRTLHGASI